MINGAILKMKDAAGLVDLLPLAYLLFPRSDRTRPNLYYFASADVASVRSRSCEVFGLNSPELGKSVL